MTMEVKPEASLPSPAKPDKPASRGRTGDPGFRDALRAVRSGKQAPPTRQDRPDKPSDTGTPRWIRFNDKLTATIDRTGTAFGPMAPASDEARQADRGDDAAVDDKAIDATVDAGGTVGLPTQATPTAFPFPFHVRRHGAAEDPAAEEADGDATGGGRISGTSRHAGKHAEDGADDDIVRLPFDDPTRPPVAEPGTKPQLFPRQGRPIQLDQAGAPDATGPKQADAKGVARATVLAEQNFPAPPVQTTASLLTSAIVADGAFLAGADKPALQAAQAQNVALPAHSLKLELHPAELGTVTASLRVVGQQLSIELKVDTQEAHRRLSADSETIVKSLRGLGYDIDRVTVLQPQIAATASARADTGASTSGQPRGGEAFGSGAAGGGAAGDGGQRAGGETGSQRQGGRSLAAGQGAQASDGLYI